MVNRPGGTAEWPASQTETRPWSQAIRSGPKEDRILTSVEVTLPPMISHRSVTVDGELAASIEAAVREIVLLDHGYGEDLAPLATMLLRAESVASSKIERVQADIDDYARALHGSKANASAVSMVAATDAFSSMISEVGRTGVIGVTTMTGAHRALMIDDPYETSEAGKIRRVQNWIGGSDHSPRGAVYVPPPPETVDSYLFDLVDFSNRSDMSSLAQAAIVHAQFESIHPFTDGNGRVGRALVNAVLRRRGTTSQVVIPLATSLVARRDRYFVSLDAYRAGDPTPIISELARAATIAASESRVSAGRLAEAEAEMRQMLGAVRRGSTIEKLIASLTSFPVLTADDALEATGASTSSVYSAIQTLEVAGVLRPLTSRKRNQVWGATLVLDEMEDLALRIELASR